MTILTMNTLANDFKETPAVNLIPVVRATLLLPLLHHAYKKQSKRGTKKIPISSQMVIHLEQISLHV